MNRFTFVVVSLSLLLTYSVAASEQLLTAVTKPEEVTIRSANTYFVDSNTYWSRQHRIVRVNEHLLFDGAGIQIDLFDGVSLTVAPTSIHKRNDGKTVVWRGEISDPSISLESLTAMGMSEQDAASLQSHLREIRIVASWTRFDEKSREKTRFFEHGEQLLGEKADSTIANWDVSASFDVWIDPTDPKSIKSYILRPFKQETGIHLLFELDPESMYVADDEYTLADPDNAARKEQHESFLRSLGEDPSKRGRE